MGRTTTCMLPRSSFRGEWADRIDLPVIVEENSRRKGTFRPDLPLKTYPPAPKSATDAPWKTREVRRGPLVFAPQFVLLLRHNSLHTQVCTRANGRSTDEANVRRHSLAGCPGGLVQAGFEAAFPSCGTVAEIVRGEGAPRGAEAGTLDPQSELMRRYGNSPEPAGSSRPGWPIASARMRWRSIGPTA